MTLLPRNISRVRVFHNLSAMLCFAFVVYFIPRYIDQREAFAKMVSSSVTELLQDVELAAQVQRLFLPVAKTAIAGLENSGQCTREGRERRLLRLYSIDAKKPSGSSIDRSSRKKASRLHS